MSRSAKRTALARKLGISPAGKSLRELQAMAGTSTNGTPKSRSKDHASQVVLSIVPAVAPGQREKIGDQIMAKLVREQGGDYQWDFGETGFAGDKGGVTESAVGYTYIGPALKPGIKRFKQGEYKIAMHISRID